MIDDLEQRSGQLPTEPNYLDKTDFYRLKYQLAAQLLNWEASREGSKRGDPLPVEQTDLAEKLGRLGFVKSAVRGEGDEWPSEHARVNLPRAALEVSRSLENDCRRRLQRHQEALEAYESASWWRRLVAFARPPAPTLEQRRLALFLESTVAPCAEVLEAAAINYLDVGPAADADLIVKRVVADQRALSYRVHYNIGCYWAESSDEDSTYSEREERLTRALQAVREALRLCPARRRKELLSWLKLDPSLTALKTDRRTAEDFLELRKRYELPEPKANAETERKPADDPRASILERILDLLREDRD